MNFGLSAVCSNASACIDGPTGAALFLMVITCFAMGYGIGHAVLWVRRLSEVA